MALWHQKMRTFATASNPIQPTNQPTKLKISQIVCCPRFFFRVPIRMAQTHAHAQPRTNCFLEETKTIKPNFSGAYPSPASPPHSSTLHCHCIVCNKSMVCVCVCVCQGLGRKVFSQNLLGGCSFHFFCFVFVTNYQKKKNGIKGIACIVWEDAQYINWDL